MMEKKLKLPSPPEPVGMYQGVVISENLLYSCGMTSRNVAHKGKLGCNLSLTDGREAAKQAALNLVAVIESSLGCLSNVRVSEVIKVNAYVVASDTFTDYSKVSDAASEVFMEYFGLSKHARTTIAVCGLPGGTCFEMDAVLRLEKR